MDNRGIRRAAVLGKPIAHSLSPALHRAAYTEWGLTGWSYDRFEIDEAALPGFFAELGSEWAGLSLTMPLKRAVIPLLDEISETAASVEAVNTVVFTEDGRRVGDNTDIPGMVSALRERGIEQVDSAAILGAGATASSALAALARICTGEVVAYVRSEARVAEMRRWGERLGVEVRVADWTDAAQALRAPLVIATTPAGATDALSSSVPERPATLFDVLYEPWPTELAARWSAYGGAVVSGLDLLVHQAIPQVEQMTGRTPAPLETMRQAGRSALSRGSTAPKAVLVGPMGVGKSTVGQLLAERLGSGFRDTDDDIVASQGRSIAEIFFGEGEAVFRAIEKRAVHAALAEHEGVLALGGGAILDEGTRALLAGQRVVYLSMDVEEAVERAGLKADRPLLAVNPRKQWRELMETRRNLYEAVATAVVPTDGRTPGEVTQAALDALELKEV
ncbi:shikimate dehydrogenase [Streptomyces montanus]|uniref:Shikimate kinase n=2 Tax=Streptomyces montanus TaxID=2580423 RepID=A0A5R9FTF3_9ACTN|nr:shikimate dehydrogenase [Streptomyces montanus]